MGIIGRTGDILTANAHDLVDRLENPQRMLKHAVREMEQAVSDQRRHVARVMAQCKFIARQVAQVEAQVALWAAHAVAAVEAGDDDLARKAISRRLSHEEQASSLRAGEAELEAARENARAQLDAMQSKLSEARHQLGTLTLRQRAAELQAKAAWIRSRTLLDPGVAGQLERLRRKVEFAEAEADALAELAAETRGPAAADYDFDFDMPSDRHG